jgi:hypothetical protein
VQSALTAVAIAYEHDSQSGNHAECLRGADSGPEAACKEEKHIFTLTPVLSICYNSE